MTLAEYLAKNYLTADPKPEKKSKKRKRKDGAASEGLVIADDDATGWDRTGGQKQGGDNEDGPLTVTLTNSADFRRKKKSSWQIVGAPAPSSAEQAAADAILASAAAESEARMAEAAQEDAPAVVDDTKKMESGAHAGLQSADAVTAQLERRRKEERRRFDEETRRNAGDDSAQKHNETIYRDASGRIINVAMKRAEARQKLEEAAAKERADEESLRGDVQRAERDKRAKDLREAKYMTLARGADDVEMNEELKARERWNDPMAKFIADEEDDAERSGNKSKGKKKKKGKSVSGRPLYKGAAPPNRYGIRPGHRWDGVDRANGFEGKWFAARNRRENLKNLDYQWQMDE